jgi:hypothetical protein
VIAIRPAAHYASRGVVRRLPRSPTCGRGLVSSGCFQRALPAAQSARNSVWRNGYPS